MKLACAFAVVVSLVAGTPAVHAELAPLLADPGAAIACQSALVEASGAFVQKKLKLLDVCHAALFKCIQTIPADDVDAGDRCLEKADAKCVKAHEKSVVLPEETAGPTDDAGSTSAPAPRSHGNGHGNGSGHGNGHAGGHGHGDD